MNTRLIALLILLSSISACASSTTLTQTGAHHPPRDGKCDFLVFASAPPRGFFEIGSVDVEPKSWAPYERIADFKEEVRPFVCQAGGDAVIAYANGHGWYIKAIVLKQMPAAPAPAPTSAPAAPPSPPAPPPAPPPVAGCQYDTQCKGERICSNGACVDPAPATATPSAPAPQ